MKRVIMPLSFPSMKGDETGAASFEISPPGEIIECLLQVKPSSGGIVSQTGKPQFDLIPTMLANIDPDATPVKRQFIVTPPLYVAESDGELKCIGRFLFPDGKMLIVYEEILETPEQKRNLLL